MSFNLDLTLQQRAALSIAETFWNQKKVKDKIIELFVSQPNLQENLIRHEWYEFTSTLLKDWNNFVLCIRLRTQMIHIINEMGKKIIDWYFYLRHENYHSVDGSLIKSIDKIYWTSFGTVDEVKIFKTFWLNNQNVAPTTKYYIACKNILEESIHHFWNDESQQLSSYIHQKHNKQILAYWKYMRDGDLSNLKKIFNKTLRSSAISGVTAYRNYLKYKSGQSVEENMFRLSISESYNIAVKYFWNKLSNVEKNRNMIESTCFIVLRYWNYDMWKTVPVENYKKEQCVEIYAFLMHQMTTKQQQLFFHELSRPVQFNHLLFIHHIFESLIPKMFVVPWPWQEMFISVLHELFQYGVISDHTVSKILHKIMSKIVENHRLQIVGINNKFQSMLSDAWSIIPKSIKRQLAKKDDFPELIYKLFLVWDFYNIRVIFNDPEIIDFKDEYIDSGNKGYKLLLMNNQFERLEQFLEEVCKSEEEKRLFKRKIHVWDEINRDQSCLPEVSVNYQCKKNDKDIHFFKCLDRNVMCKLFIKNNRYDLATKFLNWISETEEEIRYYKDQLARSTFSMKWIFSIWNRYERNLHHAKWECARFLDWLLDSEDKKFRFKNRRIVRSRICKTFILNFFKHNPAEKVEEFLLWCSYPQKEIQKLKKFSEHGYDQ